MNNPITGAEILLQSLLNHDVNTIFGYPGSCVMQVLDCLYSRKELMNHILVRHEQGAVHAAQGYAEVSKKVGVALLTSGPGATNTVTGIADAMANAIPIVVITGQVNSNLLGTDAFQEVDIIGITHSITKWVYQVRSAGEISSAIAHAFYIASTGRPGPVLLDITKDAQSEKAMYISQQTSFIRSYNPTQDSEKCEKLTPTDTADMNKNMQNRIIGIMQDMDDDLIIVLDFARLSNLNEPISHEIVKSEKFGTLGFGLPAAIGAKCAAPDKIVCLIVEAAQFQATIEELGVVMQSGIDIKIFLLNHPHEDNPDFIRLVDAYNIKGEVVLEQKYLKKDIQKVLYSKGAFVLEVRI
ncbi:thiamine pyrophosphate-binding protein [Dysgonomonas sp. ZJ709]|uniref:thiamine pyrophosphate-binding protein n=1 Tax=Dysgonomonas sp. ZJ709 TaxID=2709797 RepID=UPI0013EDD624